MMVRDVGSTVIFMVFGIALFFFAIALLIWELAVLATWPVRRGWCWVAGHRWGTIDVWVPLPFIPRSRFTCARCGLES